ncbi:MAG: hypothetical protein LC687_05150 [Actinobacteria bacterium]|nr:hypothetical protein [Actinomycetota bacterium]
MTYLRAVTAVLLESDGTTPVAGTPLANSFRRQFMDEINGPGFGSCALQVTDPGAVEVYPGRYVQILVAGTPRFTFQIEGDPQYKLVDPGEEHDEIMIFSGRGWAANLDQALVFPMNMTLNLDSSWRLFSFASPDFPNDGAWVAADELYEYLDGTSYPSVISPYRAPIAPDGLRYPAPIGYPFNTSINTLYIDPLDGTVTKLPDYEDTFWIWPPGEELSLGYAFFRRELVLADDGFYAITVTGDNFFTLFLEGVPLLGEDTLVPIWKYWKEAEIFLEAGTYQLGAVVQNPLWTLGANPGGFIMNVYQNGPGAVPTTSILVTDDDWICDFDANLWPGWTPGQIIVTMTDEATARGEMTAYAGDTFTATTDSDGDPWADAQDGSPYIPSFAADVGSTIMAALDRMVTQGHIDWHVHPDTLTLDAWSQGTAGTTPGVTLAEGVNLMTFERGSTTIYANALLVQWEKGFVQVPAPADEPTAAQTAFGSKVADVYSTDASSEDEAIRLGEVELERRATAAWPAIIARVEPTSAADCPYEGFDLFDSLAVPAFGGGTEQAKVLSISLDEDKEGYAIWDLELNRRWLVPERRDAELLRNLGGRSGRGYGIVQ